jgi:hypothetical protein
MPKTLITLLVAIGVFVCFLACHPANSTSKKDITKEFEGIIT